jgi:hypothetical protein
VDEIVFHQTFSGEVVILRAFGEIHFLPRHIFLVAETGGADAGRISHEADSACSDSRKKGALHAGSAVELAEKAYTEAYQIAEKNIPIANSTRLGLALNFSVFFYEIKNMKEEACNIAKESFNEAMKVLDDLEKVKAKDTLLIIQLLKENLILWDNEMNEEEQN